MTKSTSFGRRALIAIIVTLCASCCVPTARGQLEFDRANVAEGLVLIQAHYTGDLAGRVENDLPMKNTRVLVRQCFDTDDKVFALNSSYSIDVSPKQSKSPRTAVVVATFACDDRYSHFVNYSNVSEDQIKWKDACFEVRILSVLGESLRLNTQPGALASVEDACSAGSRR